MYDEIIYLVSPQKTDEVDEYGDPIFKDEYKEIYAQEMSVRQSEFYQAQTTGYKPEIVFKIADYLDYDNQPQIIHNDIRYKVLRTFRKGTELEITCYGGVRDECTKVSD